MLLNRLNFVVSTAAGAILLTLAGCTATPEESTPYELTNASIRTPVAGRTTTAAYFEFTNNSSQLVKIIDVSSTAAERIEMHTVVKVDEQLRMRPLTSIEVAAGETVEFASGGNHLMLFGVRLDDEPTIVQIELGNGEVVETPFQPTQFN